MSCERHVTGDTGLNAAASIPYVALNFIIKT
jgi:hypothetical protein